jgi:hypothetical protein
LGEEAGEEACDPVAAEKGTHDRNAHLSASIAVEPRVFREHQGDGCDIAARQDAHERVQQALVRLAARVEAWPAGGDMLLRAMKRLSASRLVRAQNLSDLCV